MKKFIQILAPLVLLLLFATNAFSFKATAQINKNKISINDSVILQITVDGGKAQVNTGMIQDFRVESRGSGTNLSIINGSYSRTTSYTYLLFPLKKGILTIPPIEVIDGKKITYTNKITIEVAEQTNAENISNDFFAKASISDTSLFPGQDAIYKFKFFFARPIYEARLEEHNVKGFSEKQIGKQKNYRVNINGRSYTVNEIDYLITPETAHDFIIGPTSVIAKVDMDGSNSGRFGFDSFFSSQQTIKRIQSNSIKIKVNPIPEYKGREEYKDLVGVFKIQAKINKTNIQVGDSATLTLTISGKGNIMDTSLDNIGILKDSFNIYDDQPIKKETLTESGYIKKKIFKKALVPLKPGNFTIPGISLVYFDIESGQYQKAVTSPINIIVSKSTKHKDNELQIPQDNFEKNLNTKTEVEFIGRDILPLKQGADVLTDQKELNFYLFALFVTLPFIIFCFIKLFLSFQKKEKSNSTIMRQKAVNAIQKAKNSNISHEQFLNYLRAAIISGILSKGDRIGESLTKDEAYQILNATNLANSDIEDILTTLNEIESAKYGGGSLEAIKKDQLFSKVKKFIKLFSIFLCILSFVSFVPLETNAAQITSGADRSGTLFLQGIKEYKAKNFKASAEKFEELALNRTKNGKLYYNVGNAFLKAGNIGKAILWYERAKKLIPSDADLKFNLDYAREKLTDIKESKSFNFSNIFFFWKNYISFNFIRYFTIVLSFLFFFHASYRIIKKKKIFTPSGTIIFTAFLLFFFTALTDYYQTQNSSAAIIIPEKVSVRSGLSQDSTELFILHAGTKVQIDKEQNGFFRISFSKDKLGWVKKGNIIKI